MPDPVIIGSVTPVPVAPVRPVAPPPDRPAAPVGMGRDVLTLSPELSARDKVAQGQQITGKPLGFKNQKGVDAYVRSIEQGKSQDQYDRTDFLGGTLGLKGLQASGRTDRPTVRSLRDIDGYRPNNELLGMPILPQQLAYSLAKGSPTVFMWVAGAANPVLEAFAKLEDKWDKPFVPAQTAHPTGETVEVRYAGVAHAPRALPLRFSDDFHSGIPELDQPAHGYGTYAIARATGFTDAQARRIGLMAAGVDHNVTPYGRTSPSPFDAIDRHFNLDRAHEDTRLIWAGRHLQQAILFAKQGAFDEAEVELGVGLHSLQDEFAHGQLSPAVHATVGELPDRVDLNPIAVAEATAATQAYLRAYLTAIAP